MLPNSIRAFGYLKQEKDYFVAICVNFSLFAQAKTLDAALKKIIRVIGDYIDYTMEKYPDEWETHLDRSAPDEIKQEYTNIMIEQFLAEPTFSGIKPSQSPVGLIAQSLKKRERRRPIWSSGLTFAQEIPTVNAAAGM